MASEAEHSDFFSETETQAYHWKRSVSAIYPTRIMWSGFLVIALLAGPSDLAAARELYGSLDYPRAEAALRRALETNLITDEERLEARDLLARSLVAQGRADEAVDVYHALLNEKPDAAEPVGAPKLRETFIRARFRWAAEHKAASVSAPLSALPAPLPPEQTVEGTASPKPWVTWTVAGISVAALVAGVAFATASAADSHSAGQQLRASETSRLDNQAYQKAWAANLFIGGALAGGATAGILWWRWN